MKRIIAFIFCFISISVTAQPGGGGGLIIVELLDYDLTPIGKTDSNLKIQHYRLSAKKHKVRKELISTELAKYSYSYAPVYQQFFYLPPFILKKKKYKKINTANQRVVLIYKMDTMTIDFIDILSENGAGNSDKMEEIQFESGYFKCYRLPRKSHPELWQNSNVTEEQKKEILRALEKGINVSTVFYLSTIKLIEHIPDPNRKKKEILREIKQLQKERENCKESPSGDKYSILCYQNVEVNDKDSSVNISTNQLPLNIDSSNCYHFLYYFSFEELYKMHYSEAQMAISQLKKLNSYKVKINGNWFSGQIKLAAFYKNAGGPFMYSIHILNKNDYMDGELLKTTILQDVNLDTERIYERHNR